jgi:plasmid stability protein
MAVLHIENMPDDLYERLELRAEVARRSLSEEVIALLEKELGIVRDRSVREILESIYERNRLHPPPADLPDSVEMLREDRAR